jgi:hypothetical protein
MNGNLKAFQDDLIKYDSSYKFRKDQIANNILDVYNNPISNNE